MVTFEVVETLGAGSFGVVTKNKTPTCRSYYNEHKFVAIKRIKDSNDPEAQNEVKLLSKLKHKHIVQYLEHFEDANKKDLCIVMEFCNRGTLTDFIRKNAFPVPEWNVWRIIGLISSGLKYLHNQRPSIIHCDLKPDNIFCNQPEGHGVNLKIGDFGISKILGRKAMEVYYTRDVGGTICYMAPEAFSEDRKTTAMDMWSLGAIISAYCNRGRHLFCDSEEVCDWEGGKSTLDRATYDIGLRQMTADLMYPTASLRPTASKVCEESCKENRTVNPA